MSDDDAREFGRSLARRRGANGALAAALDSVRRGLIALEDDEEDDVIPPWAPLGLGSDEDDEDDPGFRSASTQAAARLRLQA